MQTYRTILDYKQAQMRKMGNVYQEVYQKLDQMPADNLLKWGLTVGLSLGLAHGVASQSGILGTLGKGVLGAGLGVGGALAAPLAFKYLANLYER